MSNALKIYFIEKSGYVGTICLAYLLGLWAGWLTFPWWVGLYLLVGILLLCFLIVRVIGEVTFNDYR